MATWTKENVSHSGVAEPYLETGYLTEGYLSDGWVKIARENEDD